MRKPIVAYLLALPVLTVGCVRASFSPVVEDSGPADQDTHSPDQSPPDVGVCPDPPKICAGDPSGQLPCDPSCQTGQCSWCSEEKCTVSGDGTPRCVKMVSNPGMLGDSCIVSNLGSGDPGTGGQYDSCARGLICMGDYASSPPNTHCLQLCQSKSDCNAVSCHKRPVAPPGAVGASPFTASVCDPAYLTCSGPKSPNGFYGACCNPTDGTGCGPSETCYLVPVPDPVTKANLTVCESWSGDGKLNSVCGSSTECGVGLYCSSSGSSSGFCLKACDLSATSSSACSSCNPVGNQFGYCN